jgi:putative endonuclease
LIGSRTCSPATRGKVRSAQEARRAGRPRRERRGPVPAQPGYKIIVRNFRCDLGEIDIVARDGNTLVFVEVKTRAYDDPTPEDQVNPVKHHQLTKAGKFYLSRYGIPQPAARFDVDRDRLATGPRAADPAHAKRIRSHV